MQIQTGASLADVLTQTKLAASKSEAVRLTKQNAVQVNKNTVNLDFAFNQPGEQVITIGRRRRVEVCVASEVV